MNRLRELRESKKLKQKDIAALIDKTVQAYSLYELGRRNIDVDTLKTLSEFYDVPVDYLLGDSQNPNKWDLQLLGNNDDPQSVYASYAFGKVLSLKNEESKKLTLQIMEDVISLTIPQLEAISNLIKTMKQ